MGVRDLFPALCLRLGKDQEAYDFVKWYAIIHEKNDYDWGDMALPFLDTKDADVFEPVDIFIGEYCSLSYAVSVTLLKTRLILDLKSLQNSAPAGEKVPRELFDIIRSQLVSTVVAKNKDIMESTDHGPLIDTLRSQVRELYAGVKQLNKYFWPALIQPGSHLTARPPAYSRGTPEEMQLVLQYSYDSWVETPGAIDVIRELMKN